MPHPKSLFMFIQYEMTWWINKRPHCSASKETKEIKYVLVNIFAQDPFHTNRHTFPLSTPFTDHQPIQGNILYEIS